MADIKLWLKDLNGIDEDILNSVSHFIKLCQDNGYVMTITDKNNSNQTCVYGEKVCQWLSINHTPGIPQRIEELNGRHVKKVDRGSKFFAVLTNDGLVGLCSSDSSWATNGRMKKLKGYIRNIACGGFHVLLLRNDNRVFAQGSNNHGQLGNGEIIDSFETSIFTGLENVSNIRCGESHCLALTHDNRLYSWGANDHGQLGLNDTKDRYVPTLIKFASGRSCSFGKIKQISAGKYHSSILTADGTVFVWGSFEENSVGFLFPQQIYVDKFKFLASNNIYTRLYAATKHYDIIYGWLINQVNPQLKIDQKRQDRKIKSFPELYAKINTVYDCNATPLTFGWTKNKPIGDEARSPRSPRSPAVSKFQKQNST